MAALIGLLLYFEKENDMDRKLGVRINEAFVERLTIILIALFGVVIISNSFLAPICRCEVESNEYPILAIQYRGSIFLTEAEAERAKVDLPALYNETYVVRFPGDGFFRMPAVADGVWYYAYFPIYPLMCLPLKLVFQVLGVDQERCFTVTNAIMVLLSICFVQKKLKVSAKQRLLAVVLLMASPVVFNINYIYYMAVMSAFVTMSLVQWHNGRYKSGALLLSLAGMSNCSIMAVGLVMIVDYLIRTVRAYLSGPRTWKKARGYFRETVCYGLCFVPGLTQFIVNFSIHLPSYSPAGQDGYWFARFMMYLFDTNLGFGSFAPLTIILFLVLVVVGVFLKRYRMLAWGGFLLGTVAIFSLMTHINCGMTYCARYIIFTWPIVPLFLATDGYELVKPEWCKKVMYPALLACSSLLLVVNAGTGAYDFSWETQWILRKIPQLYAPYYATFYSRTLHMDGAYWCVEPAYYLDPQTDEVRKLIYKADEGQAERVLNDLTGDGDSVAYLEEKLEKNGTDGKFHYINFPASGTYQVREKTPEERGELKSVEIIVEENDMAVGNAAYGQLVSFPFTIKKDTTYKVEVTLGEETDFDDAMQARINVDFYGPGYDSPVQEATGFAQDGKYDYAFYFDSEDVGGETLDGWVRMFTIGVPEATIPVETLRVTEMEQVG